MNDESEQKALYEKSVTSRFEKLAVTEEFNQFVGNLQTSPTFTLEEKEFFIDKFRWRDLNEIAPTVWISDLLFLHEKLKSNLASRLEGEMFFLRLQGLLEELLRKIQPICESVLPEKFAILKNSQNLYSQLRSELIALGETFSVNEQMVITFIRHRCAHIFTDGYVTEMKKTDPLSDFCITLRLHDLKR